jgi:3-methyladenine DNA glycosylase AlkD
MTGAKTGSASTGRTLDDPRRALQEAADPEKAAFAQRYFRTGPGEYGEGDCFLGIRVPVLRRTAREFRALPLDAAAELLLSPWHEERFVALLLLMEQFRRSDAAGRAAIHERYLANTDRVNGWDLVDVSAELLVGAYLDSVVPFDISLLKKLARSGSIWERRIAIIATFYWIKRGSFELTMTIAGLLLDDPHDLIHKAVGWMLREVGKRDRAREEGFLREHHRRMPRTMLRYAIERFPEEMRQAYLMGRI